MKKTSILAAIAAAIVMTIATTDSVLAGPDEAKPWRAIESGGYSGIEEASNEVIQNQERWNAWWKEHTKNMFDAAHPEGTKPPEVDFEKETVLVATMGMRSTGGYEIRFSDLKREGDSLTVFLTVSSPGPDDMVTMALTYPFAIIAVPKHEGAVEFVVK